MGVDRYWETHAELQQCPAKLAAANAKIVELERELAELRTASKERVRSVVREAALHVLGDGEDVGKFMRAVASRNADAIATRVAEQLATGRP